MEPSASEVCAPFDGVISTFFETGHAFGLTRRCNSWSFREMISYFLNYCRTIFTRYKGKVKYWLTFNEINSSTAAMDALLNQGILNDLEKLTPFMAQPDIPSSASRACTTCSWPAPWR